MYTLLILHLRNTATHSDYNAARFITSGKLKPFMSRNEIRKIVKNLCAPAHSIVDNFEEIDEDSILDAYDPTIRYPKDYFIKLTTAQLQNCIFTLQDYCEKLREQIKDIKKKIKA